MELIGQDSVLNTLIKRIEENSLPQSILLSGPAGSGKHSLVNILKDKMQLEVVDITDSIDYDFILSLYLSTRKYIYQIDTDSLSVKNQNEILKFLEEPPSNCYIFLVCNNLSNVIDTVVNRCTVVRLNEYTEDKLQCFIKNDKKELLKYCNTPGQILKYIDQDIVSLESFANKIFDKIVIANHSNLFNIVNKFSWKDGEEGIDFSFFLNILKQISYTVNYDTFMLTDLLCKDCIIPNINKKYLFEKYLFDLKELHEKSF